MDSYQAIYDAVRSRISGGDVGQAVESAIREANLSHHAAMAAEVAREAAAEQCRLAGDPIDERHLSAVLQAPALVDPDLVLVVGAGHRLPTSLVWELAYSELVFLDVSFADLSAGHLEEAIASYRHRHRRFGGVD